MLLGLLLGALLLASLGAGVAAPVTKASGRALGKPGRPVAKSPSGTVQSARPLFTWSKAPRAARYEVRVYQAGALELTKTGVARLSWRCGGGLEKNVTYTWKVRARNAAGNGAWSASRRFTVALAIGDGGGKVAYILKSGDPGYVAGETHGLIAAVADQTPVSPWNIAWSNIAADLVGPAAQGVALGTGRANTAAIVAQTLGNETIGYVYCTPARLHLRQPRRGRLERLVSAQQGRAQQAVPDVPGLPERREPQLQSVPLQPGLLELI